ncbi:MAG: glycosyltransferase [Candidatus Adiutrix sp.]|jgi:glycosyltransferase involved in cell wall biosynthesis|nr:glycosyltransferase [Candidatus Adiutrix sp.]
MSMIDKPKVTVLISTYNRPQYLAEAIESVVRQRFQDWELIVLNDGGVDVGEVVEKFADPRIIYVPDRKNRGAARRFNQGLALARGEYVTYLGDDDLFYPNHLEVLSRALDEHPEVALAYSDLYAASSLADRKTGRRYVLDKRVNVSRDFNREFMFHYNHVLHVSLMHRLEAARRVGGFDEKVKVLIEWSLNRRLAFLYDFLHVGEITGEYHMPVFKSDRISVRERRDGEAYKHNLRKIRTNFPDEPWSKVERVDLLYVVEEWGDKLNEHLKEIIDSFDHPFKIVLINNGAGKTMKEIRRSLGNLLEYRSLSILNINQKEERIFACRHAAKNSNAKYLFLVSPALAAAKYPQRLFSGLDFLKAHPEHQALRWSIKEEEDHIFNCLVNREYFLRVCRPGRGGRIQFQSISFQAPKGFQFDAKFSQFKKKALEEKKTHEARLIMDEILKIKEGGPPIQYLIHYLAPILIAEKDYAPLEKELRTLIGRGYRPDNLIRLGVLLGHMGRWPEAVETLKEALAAHGLCEEDFEAGCFPFSLNRNLSVFHLFNALGEACLAVNDPGQAARYYHLASKLRTDSHKPFLGFAKVWLASGQYDRAEAALTKLPGRGGQEDPETHRLLGLLCQKRRQLDLSFRCLRKAFELGPDDEKNVEPFYFVGAALGKWEEMYNPLAAFSHKHPDHALALARLSAVCFNLQNDVLALDMAEKCLALSPSNATAKSIISRIRAREAPLAAENGLNPEIIAEVGGLKLNLNSRPISW